MTEEGRGTVVTTTAASTSAVVVTSPTSKETNTNTNANANANRNIEHEEDDASRSAAQHDETATPEMSAETVVASDNDNDDCSDGDDNGNGNGNQGQKTAEPDSIISNANTNDSSDSGDGSGGESSSDDEDGTDVDDSDDDSGTSTGGDGRNDGISAYEQLRIERIRRNQERLAQLGLVDDKKKMAKRRIIKKPKPRNEIDLPKRSQPKRSAKKRFSDGGLVDTFYIDPWGSRPSRKSSTKKSLASASASTSSSQQQNAKEKEKVAMYSRRYRCGECRACTRVNNCQTCYYCVINQRMDSGELAAVNTRRRCLFKYCWRRLIDVDGDVKTEAETEQKSSVENTRMEVKTEDSAANATKTIDPSTATATAAAAAAAATDIIASSNADGSNSKDHPIKSKELEMTRMEVEAQDSSMSTTKTIDPSAATTAAAAADDDDMIASSVANGSNSKDHPIKSKEPEMTRMEVEAQVSSVNTMETDPSAATAAADIIASSVANGSNCEDHPITSERRDDVLKDETNANIVDKKDIAGEKDGENHFQSLATDVHKDCEHQPTSATCSSKDENKGDNPEDPTKAENRTPIDYLPSYIEEEEKETGIPKWLDEFHSFLSTIPHGAQNKVPSKKNTDSTMSQVYKLVSGEGVTYHLWPEGTYFKKGVKIRLGMDLNALHAEGVAMEKMYVDRRKGGLLRHPINKLIFYKEWLTNGKPKAPTPPPSPSITAIAAETSHRPSDDVGKDEGSGDGGGAKTVTKRFEDLVKANRIKWPSDEKEGAGASIAAEEISSTNCKPDLAPSNEAAADSLTTSQENNKEIAETVGSDDNNNMIDAEKIGGAALIAGNEGNIISNLCQENKHEKSPAERNGNGTPDNPETCKTVINTANDGGQHSNQYCNKDAVTATTIKKESNADKTKRMPESCCICSKDDFLICCDGCGRGYHSNCHYPKLKEIPTGDWLCKDCKVIKKTASAKPFAKSTSVAPKKKVIMNKELFDGEHDDDCYICYEGGELICCDFCEKSFHCACHIPPLPCIPEGIWKCCECSALERKKMSRCGECTACVRDDCGTCKHCLDKPKFGGSYKLKQVCVHKVCPYPRLAPPASRASLTGDIPPVSSSMSGNTPSSTKKRGRHRKSIDGNALPTDSARKRGRGRPSKSVDTPDAPRKSIDGNALPTDSVRKRGPGRPRKSVDTPDAPRKSIDGNALPTDSAKKRGRGRPRKSVDTPDAVTVKKRGRPRKSAITENSSESDIAHDAKRAKTEPMDDEMIFRFKISSLKSAYRDADSLKIFRILKEVIRDPSDYKVVDKACELLRKCAKSPDCVKKIMIFGGIEVICNAMRDFPDRYMIQAEACCTLAELLWIYPAIAKKLTHMGAIDLIVAAIFSLPNYSKVQQMGSGALGAFSYDPNCIQHIVDAGGLRAVIAAMERFPKKLVVQKEGCYFLQNVVARSADAFSAVSKSQVVPIIVEALSLAEADAEFLQSVYGLIANLALNKALKALIGKSDCICTAILALKVNDDVEVKQAACTALRNLAMDSTDNQTKISKEGGVDAIFEAIRSFPDVPALLVLSFRLIKELCINDELVAHEVAQHSRIKTILKAMEEKSDLSAIQIAVCDLIGFLVLKGKNEILAPKLAKAVITAMENHGENNELQIQACDALFELSQVPTTHLIFKKKETQELLVRAKNNFKACESDVDDIIAASKK